MPEPLNHQSHESQDHMATCLLPYTLPLATPPNHRLAIIPFPPKANTEPVIDADYWGSEKVCFTDLFKILEEINNAKNSDVQT